MSAVSFLIIAAIVANANVDPARVDASGVSPPVIATRAPPTTCEWRIWPSAGAHSSYSGWFHGGAVDGDKRGIRGYPNMYADALDAQQQAALLRRIDWQGVANNTKVSVIVQEEPTSSADDRTRAMPLINSSASCYREIIISHSLVEAATFSSRTVRVVAISKSFGVRGTEPKTFTSMSQGAITVPEKTARDFELLMRQAVQKAYIEAVHKFAVSQSFDK